MKRCACLFLALAAAALFGLGCAARRAPGPAITQVSTLAAIAASDFEGSMLLGRLLLFGDTGIGTTEGLGGEMIIKDGQAYLAMPDGKILRPGPDTPIPFASIVPFAAEKTITISEPIDAAILEEKIPGLFENPDVFYAVKVHGHFTRVETRCGPALGKPYPPVSEAMRVQRRFLFRGLPGTLVGFYSPKFAAGIAMEGLHLHFLSEDYKKGGHVLSFQTDQAEISVMPVYRFSLSLPRSSFAQGSGRAAASP